MCAWFKKAWNYCKVCWRLGAFFALALAAGGCMLNKASHQNGIVLYVSTSGQLGIGYGETEDLPTGCKYRREVTNLSPCFWTSGTNYTHTVTIWDTTAMVTNACGSCCCTNSAAQ